MSPHVGRCLTLSSFTNIQVGLLDYNELIFAFLTEFQVVLVICSNMECILESIQHWTILCLSISENSYAEKHPKHPEVSPHVEDKQKTQTKSIRCSMNKIWSRVNATPTSGYRHPLLLP